MGGLILDSSVPIKAERQRIRADELMERIEALTGSENVGLSAIGVTELLHGIYRAESPARSEARRLFLETLLDDLPVYPYTLEVARLAGRLDGEQTMIGNSIPFPDLLIGATALSLGYSILTTNLRHFRRIPGLKVIAF